MSAFLIVLSVLVGIFGISLVAVAASAIQEIVGMITILIAVVMFVGAAIVDAVNALAKRLPDPASEKAGD